MAEPQTRIDGVRQQGCTVGDADQSMLVSVIAVDLMYAALWLVKRNGETEFIGDTPDGCPKIDSAWPACFSDGTARLCMAQADVGGGGATSHLTWIDFPDAVPPAPSTPASGGGYVAAPGGAVRVFDGTAGFSGEQRVSLAPFGIPPGVLLNLGVRVSGPKAGLVGRAGPDDPTQPGWNAGPMLNVFTQAPNVYVFGTRPLVASADNSLLVVAEIGVVNMLVDIYGWWT